MAAQLVSRRFVVSKPLAACIEEEEDESADESLLRPPAAVHISSGDAMSALRNNRSSTSPYTQEAFLRRPSILPHKLTKDELEFIARTEISSWHEQQGTRRAHEVAGYEGMEPRLIRVPKDGPDFKSFRKSGDSTWTMSRRSMSWTGSTTSSVSSYDPQQLLSAGQPKRQSLALKTEMPGHNFNSYSNGNGKGNGATRPASYRRPDSYSNRQSVTRPLKNKPGQAFRKLPKEIISLIIDDLKILHLGGDEKKQTCPTCFMRDVCSLCLTNKQLYITAQEKLYESIMLTGPDSTSQIKKRFKTKYATRLKLLRRTFKEDSRLAGLVRNLCVPSHKDAGIGDSSADADAYDDIIASVIMACPNLERFQGCQSKYDYGFSRLSHALGTRPALREHIWHLDGTANELLTYAHARRARRMAHPVEELNFLALHDKWRSLTTLAIHSSPISSTVTVLAPLCKRLPALKHLALSNLTLPSDFIQQLPQLHSLHLALPTITAQTLMDLTRSPITTSLQNLALRLPPSILSLPTLARLLSSLTSLTTLSLTSPTAPELPIGIAIYLHPYLVSASLRVLHWDVPKTDSKQSQDASTILAKAIKADGFPALRRLRAVRDNGGVLQGVCRPCAGWERSGALGRMGSLVSRSTGNIGKSKEVERKRLSRKSSANSGTFLNLNSSSSSSSGVNAVVAPTPVNELLREARAAAQARIEISRLRPR